MANPALTLESLLVQADELLKNSRYDQANITSIVNMLMVLAQRADEANTISYLDRVSPQLYAAMIANCPEKLEMVLQAYAEAQASLAGNFHFTYAEEVSRKMGQLFWTSGATPLMKAAAIQATLVAAVNLNRFAAMDSAAEMIMAVQDDPTAFQMGNMLATRMSDLAAIVSRIDARRLHGSIRVLYQEALVMSGAR
ncbi:hypothetical protein BE08_44955 [Sorangium cellulosum]|uniref:Uncharacterized protein n=1 Tax=Sorangium cellulosum TaxID=56 RepID=A0A150PC90_SORCE|nr:hypothetical protein BE08_44955 [Sorangium cellulosum]